MPEASSLLDKYLLIIVSLLQTGLYALSVFLSYYLVKKIDFKSHFTSLTPLVGVVLILIFTPFVFSSLNFISGKLFDPLVSQNKGLLEPLEGLFLLGLLLFAYRNFSRKG